MLGRVSVVMPVYNGARFIEASVAAVVDVLDSRGLDFEVIVVDDGSIDGTRAAAERAAARDARVRVVGYGDNRGKGAAFIQGFTASSGDVVVLFDADLDVPPEQIPLLLRVMESSRADVVVTNKWHPLSRVRASPLRRLLSRGFNALARALTGLVLGDTQTGAKAFRRRVLEDVIPQLYVKRYAFDVELLLVAVKRGYRVVEAPSIGEVRLDSPFRPAAIASMLLELLSITYRHGRAGRGAA